MSEPRENSSWKLWYSQPASRWEEALPVGNGRIGAMVYGGTQSEIIALNEDTLWSGFPRDSQNYEAIRHLSKVRSLLFSGKYKEAEQIIDQKMLGVRSESYLPLGNLIINQQGETTCGSYNRELNLDTALSSVKYNNDSLECLREVFVSAVDQVLVVRITATGEGSLQLTAAMDSPLKHTSGPLDGNDMLVMRGQAPSHIADNYLGDHPQSVLYEEGLGLRFEAHLRAWVNQGEVSVQDNKRLKISGATEVVLYMSAHTNFAGYDKMPNDEDNISDLCQSELASAMELGYEELYRRHLEEHHALFGRVDLDLGSNQNSLLPTDERLNVYRTGEEDPALEALYFQYGRYLLMASSRPGTQPAHLQGIWNYHIQPPWNSNYTTNINTEMNYWPSEVCNLSECHEPLISLVQDLSHTGARTAKIHYGCNGWTAHHNIDIWRAGIPSDGEASWAFWPMGGVWLSRHVWEHYVFNPDKLYLRETAYPLLKGAAEFCLDYLVTGPDNTLVTAPSTSPENKFFTEDGEKCSVSIASTMDMTLIAELFDHCIQAAEILGIDEEWTAQVKNASQKLYKPQIGEDGRLQEWSEPFKEAEPGHRHVSHLYGLYPGSSITIKETPEYAQAAKQSLHHRISQGGGHTGWSCAWLINLFARLGDGEKAHHFIRTLLARSTYPNLFDDHPPFQIDGNFGGTSGIAEMLLQSHNEVIQLLPALPTAWSKGSVSGLKARGGYVVDIHWDEAYLVSATIQSTHDGLCHISYGAESLLIKDSHGTVVSSNGAPFQTKRGESYVVNCS